MNGLLHALFFAFLVSGILLICAEVFVPGGIVGAMGGIALLLAVVVSFIVFPHSAFLIALAILVGLGASVALWIKFFPKSGIGKKMTLSNDGKDFKASQDGIGLLTGKEGETVSELRPAGFALIDGKKVDVVTEGDLIAKGVRIRVIQVEGNRVVVRKA